MGKYLVNVNFVKDGKDYFSGDIVELDDKVATSLIKEGRKEHPSLADFLTKIEEEKPAKKDKASKEVQ